MSMKRQIRWCHSVVTENDLCLMHPDEVEELVKLSEGKNCIEIGSFRGGSAKQCYPNVAH